MQVIEYNYLQDYILKQIFFLWQNAAEDFRNTGKIIPFDLGVKKIPFCELNLQLKHMNRSNCISLQICL